MCLLFLTSLLFKTAVRANEQSNITLKLRKKEQKKILCTFSVAIGEEEMRKQEMENKNEKKKTNQPLSMFPSISLYLNKKNFS